MRSKIRVVLMAAVAGVLLLGSMLLTRPTRATSEKKQPRFGMIKKQIGLVPKEVATSAYLGGMDSSEQVKLMISFDTRNQEELDKLLADLYNPSSPEFHNWLTAKQFGKRFGRPQHEVQMAADWLESQGFSVDIRYSNRLAIGFSGTPDVIERAFNVRMGRYWDPATNSAFFSNAQEPALPKEIAAFTAGMVGLNNLVTYHRPVHTFESAGKAGGARGQKVQPDGTYNGHAFLSPSDLAVVYNYQSLQNSGFKGQGQTIGIIIDSDVKDSDMAAFRSQFGLPPANLQRLVLPGLTNPGLTSDGEVEADLDTQSVSGVAPLAQIDLIVMPALTSLSIETAQQDVVNLGTIKVVNESFGGCEQGLFNGTDQALFSQAATQGIAFFAASGDSGSTCGGPSGSQGIACPACYGGVTAVGGTQIQATYNTDGSIAQKTSETVWNQPPGILCGHATSGGATGGGIGRFSPIPSYQQSAQGFAGGVPAGNGRVVPDVAALAGPPFTLIFSEGQAGLFGGTSLATPLWAGMMTLINQVQGSTQGSPNPVLYHAGISQYRNGGPAVFQDITSGDNSVQATACNPAVPGFSAGTGFDAVTGWGVPNLAILVHSFGSGGGGGCSYLLTPSNQTFSSTGGNGTFNISADSSCAWTALASDSWITIISGTSGSGGGSVTYSVAANPADGGRTGSISISGQLFSITQNGTSSGPTVELAVDGGSFQGAVGNTAGGSQYGVNRLTPASYPATLRQVKIYFTSLGGVQAGQSVNIVVGANTSGSSTIDGITFQTVSATIQSLNGFSVFDVPNITINSGDFVVGFQVTVGVGIYPFANDKVSQHQQRSYVSVDGHAFFVTDALEPTLGGNFGIRAEVTEGTTGGGGGGGGGTPTVSNVTADLVGDILTVAGVATNTGSLQGQLDIALQDANGQTVFDTGAVSTNFSSATRSNFLYQIPNMGVHPTAVSASVMVMNGQGTKSSPVSASFAGADAGGPSINRLSFDSSVLLIVGGPFSGSVQLFVNDVQVAPPAKIKIKGSSKLKISATPKSLNLNSGPNRIRVLDNGLRSNIVVFNQ